MKSIMFKFVLFLVLMFSSGLYAQEPSISTFKLPLSFDIVSTNFSSINVGDYNDPAITDLDGDGLLDLLIGEALGNINHFEQSGPNSYSFTLVTSNFNSINYGLWGSPSPSFTDLDGDGLIDMIIGHNNGNLYHYEQNSVNSTSFTLITSSFNSIDVGSYSQPEFTDIDNDDLLDLMIGESSGNINHYEQDSLNSTSFTLVTSNFNSIDVGSNSSPAFTDLDGDGLIDMIIGETSDNLNHYEQNTIGSSSFSLKNTNIASNPGGNCIPLLTDIDNDGYIDMIVGDRDSNFYLFEQDEMTSMYFGRFIVGGNTDNKYFIVGKNLTDDVNISCPEGYQISFNEFSGYSQNVYIAPDGGAVADTVFINFDPSSTGIYNGNVTHTSTGADNKTIAVTGEAFEQPAYITYQTFSNTIPLKNSNFSSINVGSSNDPAVTDLDGDGLLDMIMGEMNGNINHFEQSEPNSYTFNLVTENFNSITFGALGYPSPSFTDLDGDWLIDMILGCNTGNLYHYEQNSVNSTSFTLVTSSFNSINVGSYSKPEFTDIDNDGLLDLMIGESAGNINRYEQDAINSTSFTLVTSNFSSIDLLGDNSSPAFTDLDGDDLIDMIIGEGFDNINHYEQDSPGSSSFSLINSNIASTSSGFCNPFLTDIDNDGHIDMIVGDHDQNIYHFEQAELTSMDFGKVKQGNYIQKEYRVKAQGLYQTQNLELLSPVGFQVSDNENTGFSDQVFYNITDGRVNDTVFVRFSPQTVEVFIDSIEHSSSEITDHLRVSGTGDFAPPGNALSFDGIDDYIVADNVCLDLNNPAEITFEAWIKPALGGTGAYMAFNSSTGGNLCLSGVLSDGRIYFYDDSFTYGTTVLDSNSWYHVAITIDPSDNLKIYLNGVEEISSTTTYRPTSDGKFSIGQEWDNSTPSDFFQGDIDDVRIWNIARSISEIRENMKKNLNGDESGLVSYYSFDSAVGTTLEDISTNNNDGTLINMNDTDWIASDAMIYLPTALAPSDISISSFDINWKVNYTASKYYIDVATDSLFTSYVAGFENKEINDSTTVSDAVSGLNPAIEYFYRIRVLNEYTDQVSENSNIVSTKTLSLLPPGNALYLDGMDDFVDCGAQDISISNNATVSAWIYPTALNGIIVCQGFNHAGNENGWMFAIGEDNYGTPDPGELVWASHDATSNANEGMMVPSPASVVKLNKWQHVAASKNGTEVKLYFNSTLIHTENLVSSSISYNNGYDLHIGTQTTSEVYFNYLFPGKIDELQIWNITLTEEQIRENMKRDLDGNEAGLVAYYNFDYNKGTLLKDKSMNTNDGTLINMQDEDWVISDALIYTPTAISATLLTETSFDTNWKENYTASKYYLDVATDAGFTSFVSGFENKEISDSTTVNNSLDSLNSGTNYYYRIRAFNEYTNQLSENSNLINAKTLMGSPNNITTTINGANLELSWDAVIGATSYKVYSSNDPYGTFAEDTGGTLIGETWNIPYTESKKFYYVVAVDSGKMPVTKKKVVKKANSIR
ncbi:MAG: FG-GAP-like repeat-containing protein [Candidatus Delongbacteria bacterium]|jgi:hypothetical protein|nr:FG-GAP-like repeat-containing protein [Candidatus Delongbacteria bacterium]